MKITIIQASLVWENVQANLDNFSDKIKNIDKETELLILPEMFSTGFTPLASKVAETENGLAVLWLKETAKKYNFAIIASIIYKDKTNYKNRLFFIKPNGSFEFYDKKHLFGTVEKEALNSGNTKLIVEYKGWRICPLICYDLRFPVWSRSKNDYDLLIYIANWPDKRISHWQTLLQARAIENQSYTIGVNRIGRDGNEYTYNGKSMIISPKGEILNKIVTSEETIQTIEFDKKGQDNYRKFFAVQADADNFEII